MRNATPAEWPAPPSRGKPLLAVERFHCTKEALEVTEPPKWYAISVLPETLFFMQNAGDPLLLRTTQMERIHPEHKNKNSPTDIPYKAL